VEVSGEDVRRIETPAGEILPVRFRQDLGVRLAFPEDGEVLALGVILQAGKSDERLFPTWFTSGFDGFHQVSAAADLHDLARRRQKSTFPACSDREADVDLPIIYSSIPRLPRRLRLLAWISDTGDDIWPPNLR
jgi:hypothetical protein